MREIGKFLIQFFSTLLLLQKPRNCVCAACAWVFQQLAAEKRREEKMDVALFSPSSLFAEEDDVTVGTHFLFYISSISFYFACRKMNIVFFFFQFSDEETMETCNGYVERPHQFPEMVVYLEQF